MNGRDVTGEFFKHRDRILMPSTSFNTTFHKGLAAGAWLMCQREALTRRHVAARWMPLSLDYSNSNVHPMSGWRRAHPPKWAAEEAG